MMNYEQHICPRGGLGVPHRIGGRRVGRVSFRGACRHRRQRGSSVPGEGLPRMASSSGVRDVSESVRVLAEMNPTNRATSASRLKHTLPDLPYEYSALEPVISREIMSLHHSKHHATYVTNLNAAEEKLAQAQAKGDINTIISLTPALKFNGGGHINHTIFWQNLSPKTSNPSDILIKAIEKDFGSLENMKNQLASASVGVQGSGWGWLGYNKQMKKLQIATCQNQDPLQATTGLIPLFGIDVWEHAYYLQYKNVRADYVKAIFDVANWQDISARYENALK